MTLLPSTQLYPDDFIAVYTAIPRRLFYRLHGYTPMTLLPSTQLYPDDFIAVYTAIPR